MTVSRDGNASRQHSIGLKIVEEVHAVRIGQLGSRLHFCKVQLCTGLQEDEKGKLMKQFLHFRGDLSKGMFLMKVKTSLQRNAECDLPPGHLCGFVPDDFAADQCFCGCK